MNRSYSKIRHIQNANMLLESRLLNEATYGPFSVDLNGGPAEHEARTKANNLGMTWHNYNAWDLFAPVGTKVYSYTKGVVTGIDDSSKSTVKVVYGTGIVLRGTGGYPDSFYTHLMNVQVKVGDAVNVGDYLGDICEWSGPKHVHIGLADGYHLKDYIKDLTPKKTEPKNVSQQTNTINFNIPSADLEKMYPSQESTRVNQNFQNKFR